MSVQTKTTLSCQCGWVRARVLLPLSRLCGVLLASHEVKDVLVPFTLTRLALLIVGWFSQSFRVNPDYPHQHVAKTGWQFSPHRLIDIWGRWDSGWYLNIGQSGYAVQGDLGTVESNVAFFPLYPTLVRWVASLAPADWRTTGIWLLAGVVVSNICLLGALILLHRLVRSFLGRPDDARRAVLSVLVFPSSFFLSCFYTEALFLLLSVATFCAAARRRWAVAGVLGALLTLTRIPGITILIPLVWMALEAVRWKPQRLWPHALWFVLMPVALFGLLYSMRGLTGSWLAPLAVQGAWQREYGSPWQSILHPTPFTPYVTPIEQALTVGFIGLSVAALFTMPSVAYGLYAMALMLPGLAHGSLLSTIRYCAVVFPVFVYIGRLTKHPLVGSGLLIVSMTLQVLLMSAWCQYYWVG
ncbi:MAG: hypothetical protein GX620_03035 [Chloroflexi bacterium]|nr:hypothetical protein [Chloroflexota bacterium]